MRLIDANELVEDLRDYLYDDDELEYSKNSDKDRGYNNGLKCAIRRIKFHAPTIEAMPVTYASWGAAEIIGYDGTHPIYGRPCGKCGKHCEHVGARFCPFCGALMIPDVSNVPETNIGMFGGVINAVD